MERGTRYLIASTARSVVAANARSPITTGRWSIPSFALGLPSTEFARQHATAFAASVVAGLARGAHRTRGGKIGLGLTAASAATLWQVYRRSLDSDARVERALVDALGEDYAATAERSPMPPRTTELPTLPTPAVRRRYVQDGHVAYGEHGRRTTLDVWRRPDLPTGALAPVLVQVHGGAWMTGDKEGQGYPLMSHLAERGWVCVSVTYRLSPRATWPDHVIDVKRALAWVKDNIAEHGGDPDWVAITGGSAGGHLTALTALTPNDPQFQPGFESADTSVRAAVPFYGVYDWTGSDGCRDDITELLSTRIVKQRPADAPDVFAQASPITHVRPDAVPFLLFHGTHDSLVPVEQARAMVDRMRATSKNPVAYVEYPGAQHAFDIFSSHRTDAAVEGVERFLNAIRARTGHDTTIDLTTSSTAGS